MIVHSKIMGAGKPLLILHGFLGMGDNWQTVAKQFSKSFEVHLIDQRNHGRSFHSDDFNYQLLVKDLHHYIQHYNLDKVCLLGHSMGGKTAMQFAVKHPGFVDKLVVVDIAPRYYKTHHQDIIKGLSAVDFNIHQTRKAAEEVLKTYIPEAAIRQFLLKNVWRNSENQLAYRFYLKGLTDNLEEIGAALPDAATFDGPCLFIKGERSDYIKAADESLIKFHFPDAIIETVSNAGHWVHAENLKGFLTVTSTFLEG